MSNTSSSPMITEAQVAEFFALRGEEDGSPALARIGVLEAQIAMLQGRQVEAMAGWVADCLLAHEADCPIGVDLTTWNESKDAEYAELSAYAEVSLLLGLSDRTSDTRVHVAVQLVKRLPATVEMLCAGRITLVKARAILQETENLDDQLRARVEAQVLAKAEGLTYANLRRTTRRAVVKADKDAARKRRVKAKADRHVKVWDIGDGMSELRAVLPNAGAEALWAVLDATAHQARTPADDRTIDQIRADALVDLVCFPPGMAPRISYTVQVVSTDPDLDADVTRRLPNAKQARFIKHRDKHCVHPGCRATARTENDHTIDWAKQGPTLTTNLALRCKKHHVLKGLPGWSATQDPDGSLTLTTPSGRTYRTRPPDDEGIDEPVETVPPPPPPPPPPAPEGPPF